MPCYSYQGLVPVVGNGSFVHPLAVLLGDVVVGERCYIGAGAVLRGDFGRILVRDGANIQDNCVLHSFPGDDCIVEEEGHVGHSSILHGCAVGANALIGMGAVVMDGARVGKDAFVGALSFVKAGIVIPPHTMALGSPARVIRSLTEDEIEWKKRGTRGYQFLAAESLATMTEVEPLVREEAGRPILQPPANTSLRKARD